MIKIQPPSRQDQLIFQGLQRAIVENKAFIKINVHQLNKIGSPVFNPWENVLPMLIVVTLAIATMYIVNLTMGMLMLVVLCLIDIIIIPIILEPIITNRLVRRIVPKIEKFLVAWYYGGFKIVLQAEQSYTCTAKIEDWREFATEYFNDLIPVDPSILQQQAEQNNG
ncbi:MAG: hypothetical protein MJ250_06250 [Alphaproteobacteria bacterium]|nr:hypothetical protein [Alphaproteobacteria bacterium]